MTVKWAKEALTNLSSIAAHIAKIARCEQKPLYKKFAPKAMHWNTSPALVTQGA